MPAPLAEDGPRVRSVDIGNIPPSFWKAMIAGAVGEMRSGGALELVAEEDPIDVWHLLEAMLPGRFTWSYAENGPARWRVRVGLRCGY
ncbi:DUF2249 domain-containing protein [Oharaeibacter diazotrophicus]|uniref:Uncharacterized protein (DUF2249 family) n=1 Tax=Oharaeibacter diazotrophicus TaxID=1920512 RepID=A0A4R6RA25_9HYPH|nr:DUF2249 domain-containing protein [Oharaeibacter diazotrophicus]TDP82477.1 uncharacterized protein (DUF2249 family) [Oharaeibacter diazotrophicus]BBE72760.1 hypothetical protein OHA_1_02359 [Pleomorphomonas sp. SM30]GLS76797.1 hypothetical protein GCM10007904_21340 [Oharaeibacter diazotrophicus]